MIRKLRHTERVIRYMLCAVLAVGCGHPAAPARPATVGSGSAAAPGAPSDDPTCPLVVPGTTISVEDGKDGTALVFVTTGDAAAVRKRVAALAAMHNSHDGPDMALGMMFSTKATATATNIDGGARVTFKAKDPADAGPVAEELRMHGHTLAGASSCEMKM